MARDLISSDHDPAPPPVIDPPANPLLDTSGLPRFDEIRVEHLEPGIRQLIEQLGLLTREVGARTGALSWEEDFAVVGAANARLDQAWTIVMTLGETTGDAQIRDLMQALQPEVYASFNAYLADAALYARLRALAASPAMTSLSPERRRVLENSLQDRRLDGADLKGGAAVRLSEIIREKASLHSQFAFNTLDASEGTALWVTDPAELAGLPDEAVAAARAGALAEGRDGWRFTTQGSFVVPVLRDSESAGLRARHEDENGRLLPIAFMVCNFTPPQGAAPALLTHEDVGILFHEFGYCLHVLLSQVGEVL